MLSAYEKYEAWRHHDLACRHLGADIIGCDAGDISIVGSTSVGLSLIAQGLTWSEGDEVLVGEEEFAANVAPWLALGRLGVNVVRYPQERGQVDPEVVAEHLSSRTRLLSVSWVAFHTGWIAPLSHLASLCKDAGITLVVDAIQGLGVLPMNMRELGIDAVVADGHKWLLGPEGAGLLATSPSLRANLTPTISGWRNIVRERRSFFLNHLSFRGDGRRFEPGAGNEVGIAGLAAALDLIHASGVGEIHPRVERLQRQLTRILIAHGWEVVSPGSGQPVAGIVAARHPGVAPDKIRQRLMDRNIVCSERQGYVRFSPHFYITRGEIEAFDRILEKSGL